MSSNLQPIMWFPVKGLIQSAPPHPLPNEEAANFSTEGFDWVCEYGTKIKKRDGYAARNENAAAGTFTSLGSLYLSNGTKHELVGTNEGRVWEDDGALTAQVFASGTFSVNQPIDYTQFLDTLILMDGSASARTWSGAATGTITACPIGKYGELHLEKFFVTGIAGALSRVDYSATGNFNTWTGVGTDSFNVAQNDGSVNTGIKSFNSNELIIFKEKSMWKLLGDSYTNFFLTSVDKSVGCVCNRSIKVFRGAMIWAAHDGLYVYDGSSPKKVSQAINEFWETINKERFEWMDSMIDETRGLYFLAVSTGALTSNVRIIVVDLLHPWQDANGLHLPMFIWRISAQSLRRELSTSNEEMLTFGGVNYKYDLSYDLKSDDGAAIESYVCSPLFTFEGTIGNENCLRRMYLPLVNTNGDVEVSTEIKDGGGWVVQETISSGSPAAAFGVDFEINVSAFGADEISTTARVNCASRSRRIKVRLLQNSASEYYEIEAPIELYFKMGGQRG